MKGKITLEDHFAIDATLGHSRQFGSHVWDELSRRLLDIQDQRLRQMDESDVELMVLSLNAPAVQVVRDVNAAIELARRANDFLADQVRRRPDRLAGLAALPMQDPDAAAAELQRATKELGLKGALVNGFSELGERDDPLYYDLPQYRAFWGVVESLGFPFYLHPRNPLPGHLTAYDDHPWLLGPTWAFAAETAVHALRLIGSGLFDEHPDLKIVLGHLGEGLPFYLWRIDNRNVWMKAAHKYAARKPVADYFRTHFYLTTSGHFSSPALLNAIAEIGSDRIMFSVDYPFEDVVDAAGWFDAAPISEEDRIRIGRTNALRLFRLDRR